jgi:putative lipoprotein
MWRILLVLGLQSGGPDEHPGGDRWFGPDKVKHFFVAAFVQSVSYSVVRGVGARHEASLAAATGATAAVSVGKEIADRRAGGQVSVPDLVWDAAGAGAASLLLAHAVH